MNSDDNKSPGRVDLRNSLSGVPERILAEDLSTIIGGEHLARYLFAAHWVPGQRVADICCGVGYGTNLLSASGASYVYGLDISAAAIQEARARYPGSNLEFACADAAHEFPFSEIDTAVCFEGLEHVTQPETLLSNIARCLKKNGVAFISTPNGALSRTGHSGNPHHIHEYKFGEFKDLLSPHFGEIKLFFQWCYNDPYDFQWNPINTVRALLPVSIKHFLSSRFYPRHTENTGAPGFLTLGVSGAGNAVKSRPLPTSYLSLPGLRYGPPRIWLAVCQKPKRLG